MCVCVCDCVCACCVVLCYRVSLQEEMDELRVQAAVDAATVHELRVSLQAQREGQPLH